ncbi:MAG: Crp/Fnr family transcriptional regulator [Filifactoraceae bacterium]
MNYINILKLNPLFFKLSEKEIIHVLNCLGSRISNFQKNETILEVGTNTFELGIFLAGEAFVIQEDYWGNRAIISHLHSGDIFGESYACVPHTELGVSLISGSTSTVLFINVGKLLKTCSSCCNHHHSIIGNLLSICAKKNIFLTQKMSHITKRTTREKLLSYLSSESIKQNKDMIVIPFNRQELADYLSVDRSALSAELSKMQKEGLIRYNKNNFQLIS